MKMHVVSHVGVHTSVQPEASEVCLLFSGFFGWDLAAIHE